MDEAPTAIPSTTVRQSLINSVVPPTRDGLGLGTKPLRTVGDQLKMTVEHSSIKCLKSFLLTCVEESDTEGLKSWFERHSSCIDNNDYGNALLFAAENNRVDCLSILLQHSNPAMCSDVRRVALKRALLKGFKDAARLLIMTCKCQKNDGLMCANSTLPLAVKMGMTDVVNELIQAGAEPKTDQLIEGRPCLYVAVSQGNTEMVSFLLKAGCKPCWAEPSELVEASSNNYLEIMKLLLDAGTAKHSQHEALHVACKRNNVEAVKVLLNHGLHVNTPVYGLYPLHIAASQASVSLVSTFLKYGADVNQLDMHVRPALYHCCVNCGVKSNVLQITKILLNAGANPNLGDPTPLFLACLKKDFQLVKLLVNSGACASVPSYRDLGLTPLTLSILKGLKDITRLLICTCCVQDFDIRFLHHSPPKLSIYPMPYVGIGHHSFKTLKVLVASGGRLVNRKFLPQLMLEFQKYPELVNWLSEEMHTPQSLQLLCRRTINRSLGHGGVRKVTRLNLPKLLQEYLQFSDLSDIH